MRAPEVTLCDACSLPESDQPPDCAFDHLGNAREKELSHRGYVPLIDYLRVGQSLGVVDPDVLDVNVRSHIADLCRAKRLVGVREVAALLALDAAVVHKS